MRFDLITLFPELFAPFMTAGVTRRAFMGAPKPAASHQVPQGGQEDAGTAQRLLESAQVDVRLWNPRDHAEGNYRRVDDRPFGGGPGMVMLAEPLTRTLDAIKADRAEVAPAVIIHFSPTGRRIDQALIQSMAQGQGAVLICGRYEGIDQRFLDRHVTLELSLGDFVLSGGELPALALLDGIARLQPGVLGDAASHEQDSFSDGLLDCPHYSRPEVFDGEAAPAALLSGHHAQIARWRRERSLEITAKRRPDLIAAARAAGRLSKEDERFLACGSASGPRK